MTFITTLTIFHKGNGLHKYILPKIFNAKGVIKSPYDLPILLGNHLDYKNTGVIELIDAQ